MFFSTIPRLLQRTTAMKRTISINHGAPRLRLMLRRQFLRLPSPAPAASSFSSSSSLGFSSSSSIFSSSNNKTSSGSSEFFRISSHLLEAIRENEPVVALESTIITHGMPFPHNIELALKLENIIRQKGVIPATVGVIKGQLVVGLSQNEIEFLGSPPSLSAAAAVSQQHKSNQILKVSRRDLPYVFAHKCNGGTTVSGTIIGAVKANIPIFATGGLGGVHRGVEHSFDISADLKELGQNPITVVSAGIKSILDIGKTLEYLETEGVCVAVMKRKPDLKAKHQNHDGHNNSKSSREAATATSTNSTIIDHDGKVGTNNNHRSSTATTTTTTPTAKFPSFFTAESQFSCPYTIEDEVQGASLIHTALEFGLGSGILIAVPIPKEHEASGSKIEQAIELSLKKAKELGIEGRDVTPFLLREINNLTAGESLKANKHLIENNVLVASNLALELAKLRKGGNDGTKGKMTTERKKNDDHFHKNKVNSNNESSTSTSSYGRNLSTTDKRNDQSSRVDNHDTLKYNKTFSHQTILHSSILKEFISNRNDEIGEPSTAAAAGKPSSPIQVSANHSIHYSNEDFDELKFPLAGKGRPVKLLHG